MLIVQKQGRVGGRSVLHFGFLLGNLNMKCSGMSFCDTSLTLCTIGIFGGKISDLRQKKTKVLFRNDHVIISRDGTGYPSISVTYLLVDWIGEKLPIANNFSFSRSVSTLFENRTFA